MTKFALSKSKSFLTVFLAMILCCVFSSIALAATPTTLSSLSVSGNATGLDTINAGDLNPTYNLRVAPDTSISVSAAANTGDQIYVNDVLMGESYSQNWGITANNSTFTLVIRVVPADTGTNSENTYTLKMTPMSTVSSLSDLYLRGDNGQTISLSPSFLASRLFYTADALKTNSNVKLYLTKTENSAVVTVDGQTVTGSYATVSLANVPVDGQKIVDIMVKAESGSTTAYHVTITKINQLSTVSTLSDLTVVNDANNSNLSLSPSFTSGKTSYNINNVNGNIKVTATVSDPAASVVIKCNGTTYGNYSGVVSSPISVNSGTTVTVIVTAENGNTTNYTVNVGTSSNADLSSCYIRTNGSNVSCTPNFNKDTTTYSFSRPSYGYVTITPTVYDSNSSIRYRVNSGSYTSINSGATSSSISVSSSSVTTISVYVTAPNGNSKTYSFTTGGNDNAELSGLKVTTSTSSNSSVQTMYPTFNSDDNNYHVFLKNNESYAYIWPTAYDSNATVTVNGNTVSRGSYYRINPSTASSFASTGYATDVDIVITAQNGIDKKYYTVYVYKAASNASTDEALSGLTVRTGTSGSSTANLSPGFSSSTTSYSVNVADTISAVRFVPTANNYRAAIFVNGNKVASEYTSSSVNLVKGKNTITITVIALNRDVRTYTVVVNRGGTNSTDSYLSSLTVKANGQLINYSPSFYKNTTTYTATVDNSVTEVKLNAVTSDSNATLRINGYAETSSYYSSSVALGVGTNSIPIAVTSPSGEIRTYYMTINRKSVNTANKVVLYIGKTGATVGNKSLTMEAAPFLKRSGAYDYTMVPIRLISEAFGATVDWNEKAQLITIGYGNRTLKMTIGQKNSSVGLDIAPVVVNNRTFVPVRYVSEQLGAQVDWINQYNPITITPEN